jgi:hypothetical protein
MGSESEGGISSEGEVVVIESPVHYLMAFPLFSDAVRKFTFISGSEVVLRFLTR